MATIGIVTMAGPYPATPTTAGGKAVAFTALDVGANGNAWTAKPGDVLLVRNVHATDDATVTVVTQTNVRGRTGDLGPITLTGADFAVFGPFTTTAGIVNSAGTVFVTVTEATAADCQAVVLRQPGV